MKRKLPALCLVFMLGCCCPTHAQDRKGNPTGTWQWVAPANPDGRIPAITFALKLNGNTLTGAVTRSSGTTVITNGVCQGDEVSFQTVSEGKGKKCITTYRAKLNGDTLKGRLEMDVNGKKLPADWEARRTRR